METNISDILSIMSLLESAVSGNLLNNQPVDGQLFALYLNLNKVIAEYLDNSEPSNDVGKAALEKLHEYIKNKQSILDRKCALDVTGEYEGVSR